MPTTSNFGLRYPTLDDLADGPAAVKNLAEDVDGAFAAQDSGLQADLGWSMAAGWSLNESLHRIINGVMFIRLSVARTGAQLIGSAVGNVADTEIATLTDPATWPQMFQIASARFSDTGGTVQLSDATGIITLTDLHTAGEIDTGDNGQINFVYPLP